MHAFLIAGGLYSIPALRQTGAEDKVYSKRQELKRASALRKTWGEETVYTRYQERFEHPVALLSEHDGVGR
jgi:hypothetical protein